MMGMLSETPAPSRPIPVVRVDVRADGVAVVTLDAQAKHNTITPELALELGLALEGLEADAKVRAIVLAGKPGSFLVGADIRFLAKVRFAKDAEDAAREIARRFDRLAHGEKPVVACVHGPALGGGFELALACTAAVASDDATTALGLPEVKLGLMPAANGLLRVAERAGLRVAADLGLSGRSLRPREALALGLVDEIVAAPIALDAACALARRLAERPKARAALPRARARRGALGARATRGLLERNPIGRAVLFRRARAEAAARTRGHYPAADRMLDVLDCYGRRGFRAAADLEARLFGELVVSETASRLVELFFAHTETKKQSGLEPGERATAAPVSRVAVLGAGLMGAGIACVSVKAGLEVRMRDRDDVAIARGLRYAKDVLDARVRRGAMTALERDAALARLSGTMNHAGFRHTDLVVEAVFEDLELKHAVLAEIEALVRDDCVIASNTSAIPVARVAEGVARPDRLLGMHYFGPVHRVPLVEIVRGEHTSARAVATAVAVARRQGKTAIVVRDGVGFYTTRALGPYLNEAAHLLAEGAKVDQIDEALVEWGFPMGPLHLLDEQGIDLAARVASVAQAAFGARLEVPAVLGALRLDDRMGRKNGRGFYLYGRGERAEKRVDDTVYHAIGVVRRERHMAEEIQLRCTLAMINEALRCLDEGVLRSPRDGDVGAVLGLGFPAFRGGPFRYVDVLGAAEVLRRTRSLEQRLGARFEPAPLLVEMARKGKRFYG